MTFTVWESETCISLVRGTLPPAHLLRDEPSAVLTHTFEASSHNDSMRKHYELQGWGPYRPMLMEDGTAYPEDDAPFQED